ncbi:hypothetical protein AB0D57_37500 [Streptomyces sp. NPDC048275]|uniref:hypothetical protein n=1 Tax=Streptomyces sp. NPDC048275 TaxID=3155629 RepID=UPI0033BFDDF0
MFRFSCAAETVWPHRLHKAQEARHLDPAWEPIDILVFNQIAMAWAGLLDLVDAAADQVRAPSWQPAAPPSSPPSSTSSPPPQATPVSTARRPPSRLLATRRRMPPS